jgi:radical SAM family uncharacterized protein/radical SAM-linked protein
MLGRCGVPAAQRPIMERLEYRRRYEEILPTVERPTRYIGGEWNSIVKDRSGVAVTVALCFPDLYEIGMSHLGFRILYSLLNAREEFAAERAFCPWPDMQEALRSNRMPLATLETDTPLGEFDVLGFSLQYELTFTNVLTMLDFGGVPIRASDRKEGDPLVVAGGPVVFNVEPLADFLDCALLGDGEELFPEFLERYRELRDGGADRRTMLRELGRVPGVYVPSLYAAEPQADSGLLAAVPTDGAVFPVKRRILMDLDRFPFPADIVVPYGEIVHDRVSMEIMRGCPVGCRFCQAGYIYRPTREREPGEVVRAVGRSLAATGYDEFSLTSLNTGEYGAIQPVLVRLMDEYEPRRISAAVSSLHATTLTAELAQQIRRVRKTGFTIAPEGGTQRMRDVINKNLTEENVLDAARNAFDAGWELLKLYFMIGQPTETDDDIAGIVEISRKILAEGRSRVGGRASCTLSASSFVPKAWTPFQWLPMDRVENLDRKQEKIRALCPRGIKFRRHDTRVSYLEAVFSRGDRRLGAVLERAWRAGARFDGWSDLYRHDIWMDAFRSEGVDADLYAHTEYPVGGRLPWDVTDALVGKTWLATDLARALGTARHRALAEPTLPVCGPSACHGCAPFAKECVKGIVMETTGRPLAAEEASAPPPPPEPAASVRYRARYGKEGRLRFVSHLDLIRTLPKVFRRAGIRVAYTAGFHPKPKLSYGPALAVGLESQAEYLDFESPDPLEPREFLDRMNAAAPQGLLFLEMRALGEGEKPGAESVRRARYETRLAAPPTPAAVETLSRARAGDAFTIVRTRKGEREEVPLSPRLKDLVWDGAGNLSMVLAMDDGATLRPGEVLEGLLGREADGTVFRRAEVWVERAGRLVHPLAPRS